MSTPARILFERAAGGGGQLLRVERLPDGAGRKGAGREGAEGAGEAEREGVGRAWLFTFDVGRILVTAEGGALRGDHLVSAEDVPSGLVDASEDEPWWRLLGNPLTRVGPESPDGLDLQFRHDDANPRRVHLGIESGHVSARLVG